MNGSSRSQVRLKVPVSTTMSWVQQANTVGTNIPSICAFDPSTSWSFIPVRTCGHYIEAPAMLSIDEKRSFYMLELMKAADIAEPVSDDEEGALASYMLDDSDDTH